MEKAIPSHILEIGYGWYVIVSDSRAKLDWTGRVAKEGTYMVLGITLSQDFGGCKNHLGLGTPRFGGLDILRVEDIVGKSIPEMLLYLFFPRREKTFSSNDEDFILGLRISSSLDEGN
jgi:hypothetical protein